MTIALLFVALLVILVGAEAFTNALEHLGERLRISEGVTGSIFAAVGTALPEAMVPIVAILASTGTVEVREEVGVGAILGAPLMLSTLTLFLMAMFAAHARGWRARLTPERSGLRRDLAWFLAAFSLSALATFIPHETPLARGTIAMTLVLIYFLYLMLTVRASARLVADGHGTEADRPLFLGWLLARLGAARRAEAMPVIVAQLALGLVCIVLGAKGFVHGVETLSAWLGVSALALSLLIIPVATELPEKINSIIWIRRRRDTLAFGNITGAMVFQGTLLPALGILLTPWAPRPDVLMGIGLTLVATGYLLLQSHRTVLRPYHLIVNGLCYAAFFAVITR